MRSRDLGRRLGFLRLGRQVADAGACSARRGGRGRFRRRRGRGRRQGRYPEGDPIARIHVRSVEIPRYGDEDSPFSLAQLQFPGRHLHVAAQQEGAFGLAIGLAVQRPPDRHILDADAFVPQTRVIPEIRHVVRGNIDLHHIFFAQFVAATEGHALLDADEAHHVLLLGLGVEVIEVGQRPDDAEHDGNDQPLNAFHGFPLSV